MNPLLRRIVQRGMREGWRRGVTGGSELWTIVGGVALIGYLAGRVLGQEPKVVYSEKLQRGQTLRIFHGPEV